MKYWQIIVAVGILALVILIPTLKPVNTSSTLTNRDVVDIAKNYVETNIKDSKVTNYTITSYKDGVWKILLTYEEGRGSSCKIGRCAWEGPASMYCRPETNQSLGTCTS